MSSLLTFPSTDKRHAWWQVTAVALCANAANIVGSGSFGGDTDYFEHLKKPSISPPAWSFAPVWAFNHVTSAWANARILGAPAHTPHRSTILGLEALNWGLFASFGWMYFRKRSPTLGAANTALACATSLASAALTARVDRRSAALLVPRCAWLGLATYVSVCVARDNPDGLFTGSLVASDLPQNTSHSEHETRGGHPTQSVSTG